MKKFLFFARIVARKEYQKLLWIQLFATFCGLLSTWGEIWILKQIIDCVNNYKYQKAWEWSVYGIGLLIVILLIKRIIRHCYTLCEGELNKVILLKVADKQMSLPMYVLNSGRAHDNYERARKAINRGSIMKVTDSILLLINSGAEILSVLFVLTQLKSFIVLIMLAVVAVSVYGNRMRLQINYDKEQAGIQIERRMYYSRDYLTGPVFAKEVRAYGLIDYIINKISVGIEDYYQLGIEEMKTIYRKSWWTYLANAFQLGAVYIFVGNLLFSGKISAGEFSMYVSALLLLSSALIKAAESLQKAQNEIKYIDGLREFCEMESDRIICKDNTQKETCSDKIVFDNVTFQYNNAQYPIISNLSLEIEKGEKICLVGENGCGKTTLIKLLVGFLKPNDGRIYVNGKSFNEYGEENYLKNFSVVFQDYTVYPFSIGENVSMQEEYDEDKVKHLLNKVTLLEKIGKLSNGVNTIISERMASKGTGLSGGEEQLMVMARALYKNSDIIILDEPTASLSPLREYEFYKKFSELTQDKTVIFISHRMSACRLADRIFVMENGNIVEEGTHSELIKKSDGIYAGMYSKQADYYKV